MSTLWTVLAVAGISAVFGWLAALYWREVRRNDHLTRRLHAPEVRRAAIERGVRAQRTAAEDVVIDVGWEQRLRLFIRRRDGTALEIFASSGETVACSGSGRRPSV